jgi:hypothetical protein
VRSGKKVAENGRKLVTDLLSRLARHVRNLCQENIDRGREIGEDGVCRVKGNRQRARHQLSSSLSAMLAPVKNQIAQTIPGPALQAERMLLEPSVGAHPGRADLLPNLLREQGSPVNPYTFRNLEPSDRSRGHSIQPRHVRWSCFSTGDERSRSTPLYEVARHSSGIPQPSLPPQTIHHRRHPGPTRAVNLAPVIGAIPPFFQDHPGGGGVRSKIVDSGPTSVDESVVVEAIRVPEQRAVGWLRGVRAEKGARSRWSLLPTPGARPREGADDSPACSFHGPEVYRAGRAASAHAGSPSVVRGGSFAGPPC